jgi:NAD(P)-dependent dehydrogenase (short-subunit alcohol dehydrogenase family)
MASSKVATAMARPVHSPAIRKDYHDAIPLARYSLEAELVETIFLLCSDRANDIRGQELAVDGGFAAGGIGQPTLRREAGNSE